MSADEDRSDTESPVGPVKETPSEPLHGYVNLPQNLPDDDEEVPPVLAKKERSRYSHHFHSPPNHLVTNSQPHRKSRSRERPFTKSATVAFGPSCRPFEVPTAHDHIKERERELERIHRRSRELMLSPRLMDCSGGLSSSRDSSVDRSHKSSRNCTSPQVKSWHCQQSAPPLPPRIGSPPPKKNGSVKHSTRYKSPSPGLAPPLPPHQPRSAVHHPFLQPSLPSKALLENGNVDSLRKRVQSPRRRDFKDFSAAPRDFRSPNRFNGNGPDAFLLPGYALSPDEDEDSGADSLNEQISCYNGHENCCWQRQRPSSLQCTVCCHHQNGSSRPMSPNNCMALQPAFVDEKLKELETDKESLRLQVVVLSDQVDSQCEKIGDLEKLLEDKKEVLRRTEDILQREMINRSALETKKLELMSDMSQLKLRQAAIEKENMELRKKLAKTMQMQSNFGTVPKRSSSSSKQPLETHFNVEPKLKSSSHSGSAPNLAMMKETPEKSKSKIRKIFGRMRRSSSGNLYEDKKRSSVEPPSVRASEGSKFSGWMMNNNNQFSEPETPFGQWTLDTLGLWLNSLGLSAYAPEIRKSCKDGANLLAMTYSDLDIKLGIKNNLHRKKLFLALRAKNEGYNGPEKMTFNLESNWVVTWLDDIGLPQYKDRFIEAKIDVRVLNFITTEDLIQMKITNLLHHLSIKRGIQVLRKCNFDPGALKRRLLPSAIPDLAQNNSVTPEEVSLWTNNRVMEWLKSANLSEYAPNLRGSGVHGSLMVNEPLFSADLLASLLSIPPQKSLLMRHLNLHFGELVGKTVMQSKREAESQPNFQPLTSTSKVKNGKKSQFTLTRRNRNKLAKGEIDFEDLVCPLDSTDLSMASPDQNESK